MVFAVF